MTTLPKFSFGVGDRFGRQGRAQLRAFEMIGKDGVEAAPVWNKSHREHITIGTKPDSVRTEADAAIRAAGWKGPYFVDADHINLKNVDGFIATADFFTLDVADFVGKPDPDAAAFANRQAAPDGKPIRVELPGGLAPLAATRADIEAAANKFLGAVREAGKIYRAIEKAKKKDSFVVEVSMDETDQAQSPTELYFILAMVAEEGIPAQTIAPKFSGRFNKGVNYVGDVAGFAREFETDVAVAAAAAKAFGLPGNLKLSVHSGSDKFDIYPAIRNACRKFGAGVHLKTAGTTWVEEIAALAAAGGEGLAAAKEIYEGAFAHLDELTAPYAAVIDIKKERLPSPSEAAGWSAERFAAAIRHDAANPHYNPDARQLMHVAYKLAAKMGQRYFDLLDRNAEAVGKAVTDNIYRRHLRPLFIGD
ncbi:MAG: tagaturonate epimerase family protein [Planctomycetota bacterium]|jgi:hypothetical protein|nr:tagaturonate epimerase family protein [Planctomycetota bacterium]